MGVWTQRPVQMAVMPLGLHNHTDGAATLPETTGDSLRLCQPTALLTDSFIPTNRRDHCLPVKMFVSGGNALIAWKSQCKM